VRRTLRCDWPTGARPVDATDQAGRWQLLACGRNADFRATVVHVNATPRPPLPAGLGWRPGVDLLCAELDAPDTPAPSPTEVPR
jgi:hypothetical protein